jgi:hypothetical protein
MILQGLFNILDLYFSEIDLFYDSIDKYFRDKINQTKTFKAFLIEDLTSGPEKDLEEIVTYIIDELEQLGFNRNEVATKFSDQDLEISAKDNEQIKFGLDLYEIKIAPIVYEIFLEKVIDYLVDLNAMNILMNMKSKGFLPDEFLLRMGQLKQILKVDFEKFENLKKYIQIHQKIIRKFVDNKAKIEFLEKIDNPRDKLQLSYLIYRIIDFFHLQKLFDFSHIADYLKNNIDEWLNSIPLVTLKNPDLYFCGIYLAVHLNVQIDMKKIEMYLLNLYEENIDEFESPLFEATDGLYYYLRSTSTINLRLTNVQIKELIKVEPKFLEPQYLRSMETSQLVVILKLYNFLGLYQRIDDSIIEAIIAEIDQRKTPEGFKQFQDGFISSEATYYVIFNSYMTNTLESLSEYDLLENIISRIYRNLEMLHFSSDLNHDLLSEIFYSCESLKLLNCVETKHMIKCLADYLFPQDIVTEVLKNGTSTRPNARFRHLKVNRVTGEIIL